uniref:Uncharacterized protein n=1 Tax=Rhizophora mucronata TaxID=61149 RepID=A0A2P2P222_RHIMU
MRKTRTNQIKSETVSSCLFPASPWPVFTSVC